MIEAGEGLLPAADDGQHDLHLRPAFFLQGADGCKVEKGHIAGYSQCPLRRHVGKPCGKTRHGALAFAAVQAQGSSVPFSQRFEFEPRILHAQDDGTEVFGLGLQQRAFEESRAAKREPAFIAAHAGTQATCDEQQGDIRKRWLVPE